VIATALNRAGSDLLTTFHVHLSQTDVIAKATLDCDRVPIHGGRMCLAVPGKILSITGENFARMARVSFGGIVKEASLAYVPEAMVSDYVIVHVGFAISIVDEQQALQTFEYLKQMGELAELEPDASER
jgi:hydrogenase expression/formation protein HypC